METKVVKVEIGKLLAVVVVVLAIVAGAAAYLNSSYFKGLIILPKPVTETDIITRVAAVNTKLASDRDLLKKDLVAAGKDLSIVKEQLGVINKDAATLKLSSDAVTKLKAVNDNFNAANRILALRNQLKPAKVTAVTAITAVTKEKLMSDSDIVTAVTKSKDSDPLLMVESDYITMLNKDLNADVNLIRDVLALKSELSDLNTKTISNDTDYQNALTQKEEVASDISNNPTIQSDPEMNTAISSDLSIVEETIGVYVLNKNILNLPAATTSTTTGTVKDPTSQVYCAADMKYDSVKNQCCDAAGVCN